MRRPLEEQACLADPAAIVRGLDRSFPVAILVGCGAEKLERAAPAREFYTGRPFRATMELASLIPAPSTVLVLSGFYGLLEPDKLVQPYNHNLYGSSKGSSVVRAEADAWGVLVAAQLRRRFRTPVRLVYLCGWDYVRPIQEGLAAAGVRWPRPVDWLHGLRRGNRLVWVKRALGRLSAESGLVAKHDHESSGHY